MAQETELDAFLRSVERRAFKRTAYMVRDDEAALDAEQAELDAQDAQAQAALDAEADDK